MPNPMCAAHTMNIPFQRTEESWSHPFEKHQQFSTYMCSHIHHNMSIVVISMSQVVERETPLLQQNIKVFIVKFLDSFESKLQKGWWGQ